VGKTLVIISAGLAAGNIFYQLLFDIPQWGVALERTYFQWLAIAGVYIVFRIKEA